MVRRNVKTRQAKADKLRILKQKGREVITEPTKFVGVRGVQNLPPFKYNLRFLLDRNGIHEKDAAERIGVPRRWFKRIYVEGLQHISGRTSARLDRLASFFKIDVEDLWKPELEFSLRPVEKERVLTARQSKHWPVAEKLLTLLEDERFHFLVPMIGELHGTLTNSVPWSMGPQDRRVLCRQCQKTASVSELRKYNGICGACFVYVRDEEAEEEQESFDWKKPRCRRCNRNKSLEELTKGGGYCLKCAGAIRSIESKD